MHVLALLLQYSRWPLRGSQNLGPRPWHGLSDEPVAATARALCSEMPLDGPYWGVKNLIKI